jgi:biotin transport system substrate-specific component
MAVVSGTNATLVDYLIPARPTRSLNLLRDGLLVIGFSVFMALCAQVSFHIPSTAVPVTLQTLGVLLTGAALGSRRGGLALLAYLAEGAAGLPVFSGATGGFPILIGYTAGYLWAFPIAAFVVGLLCERRLERRFLTSALAMLPGSVIIYAMGMVGLMIVLHLNLTQAFMGGVVPFIPGDLLKLVVAALLLPSAWAIVKAVRPGSTL